MVTKKCKETVELLIQYLIEHEELHWKSETKYNCLDCRRSRDIILNDLHISLWHFEKKGDDCSKYWMSIIDESTGFREAYDSTEIPSIADLGMLLIYIKKDDDYFKQKIMELINK